MYAHRKVEEEKKHNAVFHATRFMRKLLVTSSKNRPILRTQRYNTLTASPTKMEISPGHAADYSSLQSAEVKTLCS